jgi:GT2 family glycosyltransferase
MMAYNEEANITNAIKSVLSQQPSTSEIVELVVVASGCTDGTSDCVLAAARDDARISLVVEEKRAGKASAVNRFLEAARCPVLVMVGADVLVADGTLEQLVRHFLDPQVGMVGGHPVPVNDRSTFLGHTVHLLWALHDAIARDAPKAGEIVAFRNAVTEIPTDTAVDEVSIESRLTKLGYRLVYEPNAVVYNRGPSTIADFLRQRRRIAAGHYHVARAEGYAASTMSASRTARALVRSQALTALRRPLWTLGAIGLELTARALGYCDYVQRRPHHIWSVVPTTKAEVATSVIRLAGPDLEVAAPGARRAPSATTSVPGPGTAMVAAPEAPSGATPVAVAPTPSAAPVPSLGTAAMIEHATVVIARAETVIGEAEAVIVSAKTAIAAVRAVIDAAAGAQDGTTPAAPQPTCATAGAEPRATREEGTWA